VILSVSARDNITQNQYLKIRVKNEDRDWQDAESGWETFTLTKDWVLSAGAGEKTIFIEVMDEAENISGSHYSLTIAE